MVSIEDLKKNYPVVNDLSKGKCIIVPGAEFNPDWQPELEDQGFECFDDLLDNKPVTFIQLKAEPEKPKETKPLRHQYRPEEDAYIKTLYDSNKQLNEIGKLVHAKFPNRSVFAVKKHIEKLQANGTLLMRKNMPSARKYSEEEDKLLLELLNGQGYNKSRILKKAIAEGKFKDRKAPNLLARFEALVKLQKFNVERPEQSTENDLLPLSGKSHSYRCAFVPLTETSLAEKVVAQEKQIELLQQAYDSISKALDELNSKLVKHTHDLQGRASMPMEA